MKKFLNINILIKVVVSLFVLRFFPKALDLLLCVFVLQMGMLLVEMCINSFMMAAKRRELQARIVKISSLDQEDRLKFRRPFSFLLKTIKAFYKKDFTRVVASFKGKA